MDEIARMPRKELERLQERARKLALEKSYLQLVNDLMNGLSAMPGLENCVDAVTRLILDNIGGANVALYYLVDSEIHYSDVFGEKRILATLEDKMVKRAIESGQFIEEEREFKDTKMLTPEFTKASYWALPLKVGEQIIGVLKMDSMLMAAAEVRSHLQPFFKYVALVLKNEIESNSKLKEAYDRLHKTNNDLKDAQGALRNAYEELESRIVDRTAELARVNRALRMLGDSNQALIRIAGESALLNEICRIAVEVGGYRMAWVAFAEQDEAKTLRPMAHAGIESGYIESAKLTWADNERGRGPGGTVIRTGKLCLVRNIHEDPSFAPWRESALQRGYQAIIALPLISEGLTFGAMGIYAGEADAFDDREVEILNELAGNLSYGITALRARAERKRAEEELRKSEENYKRLLDTVQEGIWVIDKEAVTTFVNPRMAEIMGYTPAEMIGKHLFYFMDEQGKLIAEYNIERRKQNIKEQHDFEFTRKDGERIYTRLETGPIFDEAGDYIGSIAAVADITERKRAEAALRVSEERFRRLAENARDIIYRMSLPNGIYEYISPAVIELFGYAPEEFYASPQLIREVIHPDWREYFGKQWSELLRGDMPPTYEYQIIHKSGEIRWVNQRNILVRDEGGRIVAIEGIVTNITERKKSEEELRKLNDELEQRVKQRTAELEQKNRDLERMNRIFVGRELRMVELKKRISALEKKAGAEG